MKVALPTPLLKTKSGLKYERFSSASIGIESQKKQEQEEEGKKKKGYEEKGNRAR